MAEHTPKSPCGADAYTDQAWIRSLKQEDPDAKAKLWEMLYCFAYGTARYKRIDLDVAYDAAVAAFRRILDRAIYRYDFRGSFPGYCRVILVNEIWRALKPELPVGEITEENEERIAAAEEERPSPDHDRVLAALQTCLEALAEKNQRQHDILTLHYYQELDYDDIAAQLSITPNYAWQLSHRGRKVLRDCLEAQGVDKEAFAI